MAVGTHRFATRYLREHQLLAAEAHEVADIAFLLNPGRMVERHRGVMHTAPAVSTGKSLLERPVPGQELGAAASGLLLAPCLDFLVIRGVIGPPACRAPRLTTVAAVPPVELGQRLLG